MLNPEYIALVKNLRGMLFGLGDESEDDAISWLVKHFRYRELGVPPKLWDQIPQKGKIRYIKHPFEFPDFLGSIADRVGVPASAVECVAFASAFATPMILLSRRAAEVIKPLSQFTFRGDPPEDDRSAKFHLRVCDYAAVDIYAWAHDSAKAVFSGRENWSSEVKKRRKVAKEDALKRFWRLGDGNGNFPLFMYLDLILGVDEPHEEFGNYLFWSLVPAWVIYA